MNQTDDFNGRPSRNQSRTLRIVRLQFVPSVTSDFGNRVHQLVVDRRILAGQNRDFIGLLKSGHFDDDEPINQCSVHHTCASVLITHVGGSDEHNTLCHWNRGSRRHFINPKITLVVI